MTNFEKMRLRLVALLEAERHPRFVIQWESDPKAPLQTAWKCRLAWTSTSPRSDVLWMYEHEGPWFVAGTGEDALANLLRSRVPGGRL